MEQVYYLRKQNGECLYFSEGQQMDDHSEIGDLCMVTVETVETILKLKSPHIGSEEKSAFISERIDQILDFTTDE